MALSTANGAPSGRTRATSTGGGALGHPRAGTVDLAIPKVRAGSCRKVLCGTVLDRAVKLTPALGEHARTEYRRVTRTTTLSFRDQPAWEAP